MVGCRGGAKVITQTENYDFEKMKESSWAIGGVYLNADFAPDGMAKKELKPFLKPWDALSEELAPKLYGGFMKVDYGMEVWTFSTVFSRVPEASLMAVSEYITQSRMPSIEHLKNLADHLQGVRYLVFARLDDSDIDTDQDFASLAMDQRNRDGRDPHANTLARTVTIGRSVLMSMEIYDLEDGTRVWSGKADSWDEILLTGEANEQSADVLVLKDNESSEVTDIHLDGIMRKAPGLMGLAGVACGKLPSAINSSIPEKVGTGEGGPGGKGEF